MTLVDSASLKTSDPGRLEQGKGRGAGRLKGEDKGASFRLDEFDKY